MNIQSKDLQPLVAVAASIAPNYNPSSLRYCVLLRNGSSTIPELVATDGTTTMISQIPGCYGYSVNVAVPAAFFSNFLSVQKYQLDLTFDGEKFLSVSPSNAKTKQESRLRAFPAEQYPETTIDTSEMELFTTVDASTLHEYINRLKATSGQEDFDYVTFTGDLVQSNNRYSFTYKDIDLERKVLRIPLFAFTHIKKLLAKHGSVRVYHDDDDVVFVGSGDNATQFWLKTALGGTSFIDVSRYREGENTLVTVAADDLRKAVGMTSGMQGYLAFTFNPPTYDGGKVDVAFYSLEDSEAPVFSASVPHSTKLEEAFKLFATTPVLKPIVDGLGSNHVAFGKRTVAGGTDVGLIISNGYAQVFAQAKGGNE